MLVSPTAKGFPKCHLCFITWNVPVEAVSRLLRLRLRNVSGWDARCTRDLAPARRNIPFSKLLITMGWSWYWCLTPLTNHLVGGHPPTTGWRSKKPVDHGKLVEGYVNHGNNGGKQPFPSRLWPNMKGSGAYCNNLSLRLVISWLLGGWWHWGVVPVKFLWTRPLIGWGASGDLYLSMPPHFYQSIYNSVFVAHSFVWLIQTCFFLLFLNISWIFEWDFKGQHEPTFFLL